MTNKEKQLLLKNLCARLHYGVKIKTSNGDGILCSIDYIPDGAYLGVSINGAVKEYFEYQDTKPYLRPMSSMTEEEKKELSCYENGIQRADFYYSHHIDCRFMIEKDLLLKHQKICIKMNKYE